MLELCLLVEPYVWNGLSRFWTDGDFCLSYNRSHLGSKPSKPCFSAYGTSIGGLNARVDLSTGNIRWQVGDLLD